MNEILNSEAGQRFGTDIQPAPKMSYNQRYYVLPTLNGLGSRDFLELTTPFEIREMEFVPLFGNRMPRLGRVLFYLAQLFRGRYRDFWCARISCVLQKSVHDLD